MAQFDLIKKAQLVSEVGDKLGVLEEIRQKLGEGKTIFDAKALVESVKEEDGDSTPITKNHYKKWLTTIKSMAKQEGVDITNKHSFEDLAFEILDNDPFLDKISGSNEATKYKIVKSLWKEFKINDVAAK